jgi:excisionase family DNA binding protein
MGLLTEGADAGVPPAFYAVGRFAQALGIGEASVYRAIHAGRLPALKFGGRYMVPAKVLDQLVAAAMNGGLVDIDTWEPGVSEVVAS